jgi:uncharacterized delta-60 repeat protein
MKPTHILLTATLFIGFVAAHCPAQPAYVLDPNFRPVIQSVGYADNAALQPDGKLVVSGSFEFVNGVPQRGPIRLNADGSLDLTFRPRLPGIAPQAFALDANQKMLFFTGTAESGQLWQNLDSSADPGFQPPLHPVGIRSNLAVEPDGSIIQPLERGFQRLAPDGSRDPTFAASIDYGWLFAVSSDRKLLIGDASVLINGKETRVGPLVRLNADGQLDVGFKPISVRAAFAAIIQPEGKIVLSGEFEVTPGVTERSLARLHPNGELDPTFQSPVGPGDILQQRDGTLIILTADRVIPHTIRIYRLSSNGVVQPLIRA